MYRVAQEQLFHPRYTTLRGVLYSYAAEGGLTGKQLVAVTEVRRAWGGGGCGIGGCAGMPQGQKWFVRSCLFL